MAVDLQEILHFISDKNVISFIALIVTIIIFNINVRVSTHDRVYSHYTEISKLFLNKPCLRKYFYGGKLYSDNESSSDETEAKLRDEIDIMSEAILGLIEHAVLQSRFMQSDTRNNCWIAYTKELMKGAELKSFYYKNRHIYTKKVQKVIDRCIV
jgi:hypothetical protein